MLTTGQILGAALAACLVLPTATRADTAASVGRSAAEAWDRIYNSGDMDTLGTLYAPDAQVIPKGAAISGPADIRTFFAGLKAKGFDDHRITVQSAREKGDVLVLSGRWAMTGPGEGGARKRFEGNWVNVMERSPEGWRTVLHTWN
jgi:ketosteroid isomerase-like protein